MLPEFCFEHDAMLQTMSNTAEDHRPAWKKQTPPRPASQHDRTFGYGLSREQLLSI